MDLKADTTVTIQVDFLRAYPRGDGLRRGGVRQVKTRIPGEATYPEAIIVFHH